MNYKWTAAALALCLFLSGCNGAVAPASTGASNSEEMIEPARETPAEPDPQGAIQAVYSMEGLEETIYEEIDQDRIREIIVNPDFRAVELYACYSDPRNGLADVIFAKPLTGEEESMIAWLYRYQERRVAEFENYDILDSYAISKDAVVYLQGGYVILLMLPDNDAAQYVIDDYIPQ